MGCIRDCSQHMSITVRKEMVTLERNILGYCGYQLNLWLRSNHQSSKNIRQEL